jgi:hypothetical protein
MASHYFSPGFLISGAAVPDPPPKSGYRSSLKIEGIGYKQTVMNSQGSVPTAGTTINFSPFQSSWCVIGIYRDDDFDQSMDFSAAITLTDQYDSTRSYTKNCRFLFNGTEKVYGEDIFQDITVSGDIDVFQWATVNTSKGIVTTTFRENFRGPQNIGKVWFNFNNKSRPLVEMKLRWPKFS